MFSRRYVIKCTGVYLIGYVILIGALLAALRKLGVPASIGTAWSLIGVMIAEGELRKYRLIQS